MNGIFSGIYVILLAQIIQYSESLICLSCNDVIQPRHCHVIGYCAADEVCFVERYIGPNGLRFNTGCMRRRTCSETHRNVTGKTEQSPDSLYCSECCDSDFCNSKGCGQPGYPDDRGPICFNCKQRRSSEDCHSIAYCRNFEVCRIQEDSEFGDDIFSSDCIPAQYCKYITSREGSIAALSHTHNFTRAPSSYPSTTRLMTKPQTTKPEPQTIKPEPQTSTPEPQTTNPGPQTPKLYVMRSTAVTHSYSTTPMSILPEGVVLGKRSNTFGNHQTEIDVKRGQMEKRYTECTECCSGDLCNFMCKVHRETTADPKVTDLTPTNPGPIMHSVPDFITSTTSIDAINSTLSLVSESTSVSPVDTVSYFRTNSGKSTPTSIENTTIIFVSPTNQGSQATQNAIGREFLLLFTKHDNKNDADNITLLLTSETEGKISIFDPQTDSYLNTSLIKGSNKINILLNNTVLPMTVEHKGIHVTTDVDVTMHVMEYRNVADSAYLALPVHFLSTKYVAASYPALALSNPSHVTVGALYNNTIVSFSPTENVTFSYMGKTYGYGDTLNVTLDSLDTFQLASRDDLTGVRIQSNNKIAVLSGTTFTVIPSVVAGNIVDAQTLEQMMPPVPALGKQFIVPPLEVSKQFHVRVISAFENTTVNIDGQLYHFSEGGEFTEIDFQRNTPISISSDKPVLVVEYSDTMHSQNDHSSGTMMIVPAVVNYLPLYNFTVPDPPKRNYQSTYHHFISVIIPGDQIDSLFIDNKPYWMFSGGIHTVNLDGKYYCVVSREVQPGLHTIRSTTNTPFGLVTYGFDYAQGYGYPVNLRQPSNI